LLHSELPAHLGSLVDNILGFSDPVESLVGEAREISVRMDNDRVLTVSHAKHVAAQLEAGADLASAIAWARFLIVRRDVGLQAGHEAEIQEFLEHLSYSRVVRPFTPEEASTWVSRFDIATTQD
jgi:hypothetical protein